MNSELLVLGFIAGFTIFLGLPIAFLPEKRKLKGFLNSLATGVLIFLLIEVLHEVFEAVEHSFEGFSKTGQMADLALQSGIVTAGLVIGLLGLVLFESKFIKSRPFRISGLDKARYLAAMIAVGIGLHNFSEGLAIGQSYASGAISLATLLAVGFGLHNMTEGFGISGPLHGSRPSWKFLFLLGMIAGFPTFIGTLLGSVYTSGLVSLLFLALAGGAIIYVIKELLYHGRLEGEDLLMMSGIVVGLLLGLGAELIIEAA